MRDAARLPVTWHGGVDISYNNAAAVIPRKFALPEFSPVTSTRVFFEMPVQK